LINSDIPLAIFPGGTGNAMAHELRIPLKLEQAAELVCQSKHLRSIDMAHINGTYFMLRAYTGVEPDQRASREMKDQYGNLAYIGDTMRMLSHPPHASYQLTIDGQEINEQGMTCLILNAGSLGGIDLRLTKRIDVSDGLLDVFIVNRDLKSITALATYTLEVGSSQTNLHHWQGREIIIDADSPNQSGSMASFSGLLPKRSLLCPAPFKW
jgi:diacylglycerol kinase family enzyme